MRLFKICFLTAIFLAPLSCTPKVAGLQVSDVFTHPNIAREGMIIGGVVSASEELKQSSKTSYANMLKTGVLEEREDFKVSSIGTFINSVGKKRANEIWTSYRTTGEVSAKDLASIAQKVPNKRFVIFAKIENDDVSETNNRTEGHYRNNDDGTKTWVRGKTVVSTSRGVSVTMDIFDLKLKNSAFSGSMTRSNSNQKEYTDAPKKTASLGSGIASIIRAAKGTKEEPEAQREYPAPTAPTVVSLLKPIFHGFAMNFPEKD